MNLLKFFSQATINDIIGDIKPPVDDPTYTDPTTGLNNLVFLGIKLFITFAALVTLVYLLWGAFDWITSAGEKENLEKARQKITNAIIGIILVVVALSIFSIVTGDILGIVKKDAAGNWKFSIPTINQESGGVPGGGEGSPGCIAFQDSCTVGGAACCDGAMCVNVGGNFRCTFP